MRKKKIRDDTPIYDNCTQWDDTQVKVDLPATFTWRNAPGVVGPVRDQVACGSCWAFGTAEAIESQLGLRTGVSRQISVQQIVDCTWDNHNYACDGGEVNQALSSMMNGSLPIAYEEDYPYLGIGGVCNRNQSTYEQAGKVKACYHIAKNREAVKKALYTFGPLSIGIAVTESMLLYTDGVFDDPTCIGVASALDHAVLLTGWTVIDGKEAWEVKNSWSTWWGWDGYIYIQSENQEWNCGVTTDAVAVVIDKN
jgi:C1A family cysteine protease